MSVLSRGAFPYKAANGAHNLILGTRQSLRSSRGLEQSIAYLASQRAQPSSRLISAAKDLRTPLLRSEYLPRTFQVSPFNSHRSFSSTSPSLQGETNPDVKSQTKSNQTESAKQEPAQSSEQSKKEEEAKQEGEQEDNQSEEQKKSKEKKSEEPPPPPHGDKSPWQVFTETLQTEFKKSKEWNESTKQLGGAVQDFTQNETVRRVREGYTSASGAASSTTAKVLSSTGKSIGQGAAWTWNTMPVKGLRAGVSATASGLEKITRPVRETEAYKSVANVIDDGSSSRYGGWTEKEERQRRREARELEEAKRTGRPVRSQAPLEEDPDAGTNITLHKDAKWKESWRDFRDQSKLMQGLFSMKSAYNESENPLISTARSITDRIAGFFAENETAMVVKKFREMDPNFQMEPFLQDMREYILPDVLEAYVKGDVKTLTQWLSAAQAQVYEALMKQYTQNGLKSDGKILDIRNVDIVSARLLEPGEIPVFILSCRTQEVHVYRNVKSGELAAGMEDRVQQVTYAIGVTRVPEDVSNPETRGWRIIELQKSARDFI